MYLALAGFAIPDDIRARKRKALAGGYRVEMYDPGRHEGLAEMLDGFDNPLWRRQIPEYAASGAPLVVAACEGKAAGFAVPVLREESGRGFFAGIGVHPRHEGHGLVEELTAGNGGPVGRDMAEYREQKVREAAEFAEMLGGEAIVFDIPDGELADSEEMRYRVCDVIRRVRPNIIITHFKNSMHKDHMATHRIVVDACFFCRTGLAAAGAAGAFRFPAVLCVENWEDAVGYKPYVYIHSHEEAGAMVRNGIDRIMSHAHLFRGKRIGLITSPAGMTAEFVSTIRILHENFHLAALFSPEHGVRGDLAAGAPVDTYQDPYTGVTVYSLYRQDSKRMTPEMLDEVDVVVYDIQDVGVRYYTYIYTMLYALEDCAKAGKEFVVLDRINPLDGVTVEGNVLKPGYESFVGNYPLCVRYGLTAGEVAAMANEQQGWKAELYIVPCEGWDPRMLFPETGRIWVHPSLNVPRFETALLYGGTCLFEGTILSEGRGTTFPFEMIGAPFIEPEGLAAEMNAKRLPGVRFRPVYFQPAASKFAGELCGGVQLYVTDPRALQAVETGVTLLYTIKCNYEAFAYLPPVKENSRPFIDLLCGDKLYREGAAPLPEMLERFREESRAFAKIKEDYHLYPRGRGE